MKKKKGVAVLTHPEQQAAQAALMLTERLGGKTIGEIQQAFGVSRSTVHRRLNLAEQHGLLETAKAILLERLLPKALAVYDAALDDGEREIARDVIFGLGALRKTATVTTVPSSVEDNEETLEDFRARLFAQRHATGAIQQKVSESAETEPVDVIDVSVTSD